MTRLFYYLTITLLLLTSCGRPPQAPPLSSSEAVSKFQSFCEVEFKYPIVTRLVGKTLWIYLPITESFVDMKATPPKPQKPPVAPEKITLSYVETHFENNDFVIRYAVGKNKIFPVKDLGYGTSYTEDLQKKQNNIFSAIQRAFFEADEPPEFIGIVITDVAHGLEVENMMNFDDFKKATANPPGLPHEEFIKRYLSDVRGNPDAIGDKTGRHLSWKEVAWPEFLSRQIDNRIRFKYQQSDFPTSDDAVKEIRQILSDTFPTYAFKDFNSVVLEDLNTGEKTQLQKKDL